MSTNHTLITRIQAQLSAAASENFDTVALSPFTLYINPDSDSPWNNYAIPDEPVTGDMASTIDALCVAFRAQERQPRLEYIDEFTPALAPALAAYGFTEEMHTQLMICTPATYLMAPPSATLHIDRIPDNGSLELFQDLMTVQSRAFGDDNAPRVDVVEADQFRTRFASTQFFAAWLTEHQKQSMVSVASLMAPFDGITEIAGIATLQAYRRQGIATALTAHAVQQAFAQGITGVFLTAADAAAGRVYERVGFYTIGTGLAYSLPPE